MLSILIPVFNYDCFNLVMLLHNQAEAAGIPYEILCFDDCSPINHDNLACLPIKYRRMDKNQGRSRIRNLLASQARFDNLLFIDCDCLPDGSKFIGRYLKSADDADCLCGGVAYPEKAAIKPSQTLHWTYGTRREMRANPSRFQFMASNFLIKRAVFEKVRFNCEMEGYGHEDTLFGIELAALNFKIKTLQNPVIHLGLNDCERFLQNNRQAAVNLRHLYEESGYENAFSQLGLVKTFSQIHKIRLDIPLRWLQPALCRILKWQLRGQNPKMWLLDLYKLLYFAEGQK